MKRKRFLLMMREGFLLSCLLLLLLDRCFDAACPSVCSCSESFREVDCSWRGLRHLPSGIQFNIHFLNLSHNRLTDLDHALAPFTHLRNLDISHNRLSRMPALLPRSLWEIQASGNRIRLLEKNATAYHWNLRHLDLSANRLERVVFINNTLTELQALNLSCNKFWTVPTNMPRNLEMIDLSHNSLVQILPGSLDRLPKLTRIYLHANRFSTVCKGAFEQLHELKLITLGDNPWACDEPANIEDLLDWTRYTSARVLGCPCHTWPTCGQAQLARTTGWHFSSYTLSPYRTTSWEVSHQSGVTTHYRPEEGSNKKDVLSSSTSLSGASTEMPFTEDFLTSSTVLTTTTRRTTTLRTRSVKRNNQRLGKNSSEKYYACASTVLLNLLLLVITDQVL
ncbi:oligodendrocyte-myelin glycoprotein-like [Trichomycterus rosablanca]|uniref:oligodendrocyte-myelin glycoprotein-like n=1 Tax=Trichomycterus rosablanca TaxID=2290929 RepID=UPI002F34EFCE